MVGAVGRLNSGRELTCCLFCSCEGGQEGGGGGGQGGGRGSRSGRQPATPQLAGGTCVLSCCNCCINLTRWFYCSWQVLRFSNENSYLNWARNGVLSSAVGVAMYAQEHHRGAQLSGAGESATLRVACEGDGGGY